MEKTLTFLVKFIGTIIVAIVLSLFINQYVMQLSVVTGNSMQNNLHNGQILLLNKMQNIFDVKRYDVIVFETNDKYHRYLVKRVYGLPGETIQIKNSTIYVNGRKIEDTYKKDKTFKSGIANKTIKLAQDEYFVLGDNRNNSYDSRYEKLGPIKEDKILGDAILSLSPFGNKIK